VPNQYVIKADPPLCDKLTVRKVDMLYLIDHSVITLLTMSDDHLEGLTLTDNPWFHPYELHYEQFAMHRKSTPKIDAPLFTGEWTGKWEYRPAGNGGGDMDFDLWQEGDVVKLTIKEGSTGASGSLVGKKMIGYVPKAAFVGRCENEKKEVWIIMDSREMTGAVFDLVTDSHDKKIKTTKLDYAIELCRKALKDAACLPMPAVPGPSSAPR
jgi:hypothetical protein